MKTKLCNKLLLSSLVFMFMSTPSRAQWTTINTDIPGSIGKLEAPSADTVFLRSEKLYRTFDGGDTFDSLTLPEINRVTHIDFINGKTGYAAASNDNNHVNEIFLTRNSGNDWTRITPPQKMDLVENIAFATPEKGIVMLTPRSNHREGFYHFTKDAGQSWELIGPLSGIYLKNAEFAGETGFAIVHTFEVNEPDQIMKSTDGGYSWARVYSPSDTVNTFEGIQVISENEAIAYLNDVDNLKANLYHTVNGGASWNRKSFDGQILAMSFSSGMNGILIDDNGAIFRTVNGGETWEEDRPSDDKLLSVVSVFNIAYAGGIKGTLIKRSAIDNVSELVSEQESGIAYPNPSKGSVLIPTDLFGSLLKIEIKDVTGKLVGQKEIRGYHDVIQLNDLPSGVLFISVTDEYDQYKTYKVVVE